MQRVRVATFLLLVASFGVAAAQSFEVATIRPVDATAKSGRFLRMTNDHTFLAKNLTLKQLIAGAYDINPSSIYGTSGWMETQKFQIDARTPGDAFPSRDVQMAMLRALLEERFQLTLHRETKVMSCYELTVAKSGSKLLPTKSEDYMPQVTSIVSADHVTMPAKNASMDDLVKVLRRGILDHPVVDQTGLTGRYDFNLEWAPDESQFEGAVHLVDDTKSPPLVVALRDELGLELKPTRGPVETIVVDKAERPDEN